MKKYYCLKLNNCYDEIGHWVCPERFSAIPNVLEKDITDLDHLESEFMDLDDTIIPTEKAYHVLGSFPIFGEIKVDGQMHDVITGDLIEYAKDPKCAKGLSYRDKIEANEMMATELMTLMDEETRMRYIEGLNKIAAYSKMAYFFQEEPEKYFAIRLTNTNPELQTVIAEEVNGELVEQITKAKIYPVTNPDTVSRNLSANVAMITEISKSAAHRGILDIVKDSVFSYTRYLAETKQTSVRKYNTYVSINKDKVKTRKRTK